LGDIGISQREGQTAPRPAVLDAIAPLVGAGFSVHWLKQRSKAPVANAWSTAPIQSLADLGASYCPGFNVGVRLGEPSRVGGGYLHVIDLDVRDPSLADEAQAALARFLPEFETLPFVISGSGGASRHYYMLVERPFRSKKLFHSAEKFKDAKGREHWSFEGELFGTGKQVVLPSSLHPKTGAAYEWGREIDFDDLALGVGPFVGEARVATWAPSAGATETDDEDDLSALVRAKPMGLTRAKIDSCLAGLPLPDYCEDRDGWLTVGMALHHEFEGSAEGLAVWNAFSRQSPKFDERDQAKTWRSFMSSRRPTRIATLIKASARARFSAEEDYGDDVDLGSDLNDDDLLGAAPDPDEATTKWDSLLDLNEEGAIKPTLHNVELLVRNDPRVAGLPAFNEFTQEVVLRRPAGTLKRGRKRAKPAKQLNSPIWTPRDSVSGDLWLDRMDDGIRNLFEAPKSQGGYGVKVSDRDLEAAIGLVASENRFHPVRDYLNGLVWDGEPRLESLFVRYLGATDSPYTRSVARLTLLGAVTRAYEPGHKFDFVTILEGIQGVRKSTFLKIMARNWFAEIEGNFEDRKAMVEKMQGSWILELPELQGFGRHEVQIIKAFVSTQTDKVRLAYGRRAQDFPRQCIFIGSTNDSKYLRDPTGGRRFWPIACTVEEIDTDAFEAEVDQVWAEATEIYRTMRAAQPYGTLPLHITDADARAEAWEKQEGRRIVSVDEELAGRIAAWLEKPMTDESGFDEEDALLGGSAPVMRDVVCSMAVWCEMLGRDLSHYGQVQQQQFGRALAMVPGWEPARAAKVEKYGRQRIYRRIGAPLV